MTSLVTPHRPASRLAHAFGALALVATLSACVTAPPAEPVAVPTGRTADQALADAKRSYDDGNYPEVERQATEALKLGLHGPANIAAAHKLRAFVYCTSNRLAACESEFREARVADPGFALTKAEAGHPVWGPVYLKSRQ